MPEHKDGYESVAENVEENDILDIDSTMIL